MDAKPFFIGFSTELLKTVTAHSQSSTQENCLEEKLPSDRCDVRAMILQFSCNNPASDETTYPERR